MTKPIKSCEIADLLDQYGASLELYASQWVESPEDCVQEAFVALASQTTQPENQVAWLYRVVRNRALNDFRSSRRRNERERIAAKPEFRPADHSIQSVNEGIRIELLNALEGLPTEDRELIVLRIWSGLGWREIAELTSTSSSTAQRRYVRALEKMKLRLETECLTKPD